MSQKLPLDGIKWVEEASQLNEDFMKRYNEDNDIGYFIETDVQYSRKLYELHNDIISLSCHEQVCLSGLRFERYFSHHRAR